MTSQGSESGKVGSLGPPPTGFQWQALIHYGLGSVVMLYGWLALYMGYEMMTGKPILWQTYACVFICYQYELLSVTGGLHRLWSHRSYKAAWPLRMFYMVGATMGNLDITVFARTHRVHHKYTDTDMDPHNARRGMFFSHMGFQILKMRPEVRKALMEVDISDLNADPVVRLQRVLMKNYMRHFWAYVFPGFLAMWGWNEAFFTGILIAGLTRRFMGYHTVMLVNSLDHAWGDRPYDPNGNNLAVETWLGSLLTLGEGWHNYHHAFAFDYAAAELHWSQQYNPTTAFIDLMWLLGQAWDCKRGTRLWDLRKQQWEKNTGQKVVESVVGPPLFRIRKITYGPEPYEMPCLLGSESPEALCKEE